MHFPNNVCPQKREQTKIDCRFTNSQRILQCSQILLRGHTGSDQPGQTKRPHDYARPQKRFPSHSYFRGGSGISRVSVQGKILQMESPPVWSENKPVCFLQDNSGSGTAPTAVKLKGCGVHGRFLAHSSRNGHRKSQSHIVEHPGKTWPHGELGKIRPPTEYDKRVHRLQGVYRGHTDAQDSQRSDFNAYQIAPSSSENGHYTGTAIGTHRRPMHFDVQSNPPGEITVTKCLPPASNKILMGARTCHGHSNTRRPTLVGPCSKILEWKPHRTRPSGHTDDYGCLIYRMGCDLRRTGGSRLLELPTVNVALELPGTHGNIACAKNIQALAQCKGSSAYGQHHSDSIREPSGRPKQAIVRDSKRHLVGSLRTKHNASGSIPPRVAKCGRGQALAPTERVRVAASPKLVCIFDRVMGPILDRQVCNAGKCPIAGLQQQVRRTALNRCGRTCTEGLGLAQQLLQPTVSPATSTARCHRKTTCMGDNNCPKMASPAMVSASGSLAGLSAAKATKVERIHPQSSPARAMEEQTMGSLCLASMWRQNLRAQGWSKRATIQLPLCLAPSTLAAYNRCVNKLYKFCCEKKVGFPPVQSDIVADFLCNVADTSEAPRSQLKVMQAALSYLYQVMGKQNPLNTVPVQMLITALIKSGTQQPMTRSKVMPVTPFADLFRKWPDNEKLSLKQLRLKTITLMALTLMLRPSDIAPKSVHFDKDTHDVSICLFSTDNVKFCDDGAAQLVFHGIKNDTAREGFQVLMQPVTEGKLNPVQALKVYIERTDLVRPRGNPVFLSLLPPHGPISAATVSSVLNEAIHLANLSGQGFSAKSFRPTGATAAIDLGHDPDITMRLGRWKTRSVFFDHYVHSKPPASMSADILGYDL